MTGPHEKSVECIDSLAIATLQFRLGTAQAIVHTGTAPRQMATRWGGARR